MFMLKRPFVFILRIVRQLGLPLLVQLVLCTTAELQAGALRCVDGECPSLNWGLGFLIGRDLLLGLITMSVLAFLSADFVRAVHGLQSRKDGYSFLLRRLFGSASFKPYLLVREGKLMATETDPLVRVGGPGNLVIYYDSAVILQKAGRLTRVERGVFSALDDFEKVWDVVDLRPQRRLFSVNAMTSDGISVTFEVDVTFRIDSGGQEPSKDEPYPAVGRAILLAGTSKWIFKDSESGYVQVQDWKDIAVFGITDDALRSILATCSLHELLGSADYRGKVLRELKAELCRSFPDIGVELMNVELGDITVDGNIALLLSEPTEQPARFLIRAGFTVQATDDSSGLLCVSDHPLWADISPFYVRLVLERPLDMKEFEALCAAAEAAYGEDLRGHSAAVVIDRPPQPADLYYIFALRSQRGFTVIPLPRSLMGQAQREGREMEALQEQVELYTGRADLYGVRAAVTDVLSFFGHSGLLADLERRLIAGESAIVFGVRKVGKSSLLHRLREECRWPVALVDLQGYSGGLEYVYREALRGWQIALQTAFPDLPLPDWTDDFSTPDPAAQAQAFRRTVEGLLDLLTDQTGRPGLLLFLDEIEYLFGQPEYLEFAAALRSVAEAPYSQGRFALLVASLEPALNRIDRMNGKRNPFYAFFSEVPLGPLQPEDARIMIVSIGGQMGISYEDEALDLLVDAGGGHPFLTRQLCSQAIRDLERPGTVDMARAARAVKEYLHRPRNYVAETLWGIYTGGPPATEATLLRSLAAAQPQLEKSLIPSDLPPEERLARRLALEHLRDQSLIRRVEGGWELSIPLYRHWIRRYILNLPNEVTAEAGR